MNDDAGTPGVKKNNVESSPSKEAVPQMKFLSSFFALGRFFGGLLLSRRMHMANHRDQRLVMQPLECQPCYTYQRFSSKYLIHGLIADWFCSEFIF